MKLRHNVIFCTASTFSVFHLRQSDARRLVLIVSVSCWTQINSDPGVCLLSLVNADSWLKYPEFLARQCRETKQRLHQLYDPVCSNFAVAWREMLGRTWYCRQRHDTWQTWRGRDIQVQQYLKYADSLELCHLTVRAQWQSGRFQVNEVKQKLHLLSAWDSWKSADVVLNLCKWWWHWIYKVPTVAVCFDL
jgi:hypothetical protein